MSLLNVNLSFIESEIATFTRRRRVRARKSLSRAPTPDRFEEDVVYDRTKRYMDVMLPELAAAAAWVVVMKMAYGLDGRKR
jgi:hypothetical protein